jgi:hypothetical protein
VAQTRWVSAGQVEVGGNQLLMSRISVASPLHCLSNTAQVPRRRCPSHTHHAAPARRPGALLTHHRLPGVR